MLSLYAATKSAIRGLTQGAGEYRYMCTNEAHLVALDLGKFGITVNSYAPGSTIIDIP